MALPAKLQADVNFRRGLAAAAGVSVLALAAIVIFLLSQALPIFAHVSLKDFLFSTEWYPTDEPPVFGIGALIAGSLACAALTTLIAVPFGVLTACAIHAGMPPALTRIVKPLIELMAALPSVVIGFIGMIILAPWLQDMFGIATGLNLFNASIMLAFMCVPTIASISEDALRNVPSGLREASLALGATRWETLLKVELRWAMGGIATAVMLGISRVIGETMVVLMVAGGAAIIPESIFDPVRPMTSSIAAEMAEAAVGGEHYHALYATGLVLFIITFAFNLCAWYAARRFGLETK
ncbi:phosphate ABC transporter permease subunit PstC [Sutterella wadsworthensis]|uniref:phosphate ABC transporter permease subunit PstC n=1 Tax=Sutterella wadsworthensis TaxID=40545 RepID=UPI003A8F42E0